ncbi:MULTISPECIES: radical SAM family heme chaperone HemW [Deefgea]|uniref:Heme chaperone HemW n=1 Tax=Deefgea chitinilytica TaxID=570276 RepID=A0ABS2C801_9NEIS|nr:MULTISPECIES: radical SAM family heme chaperone HemW [Deefgea]MBM5570275.1 oxygen-independent coproporphyrinogen III oxidase-like protein [Deefgea chitinilytica]MBM9887504.1 oxygen-independent coproporphyrinogen III oxidase-like protein [Deefgea sp. CFH1-16]
MQTVSFSQSGLTALPPLALYIHFPWCVRKCPYCDFNSHAVKEGIPENAYIDALITDLESNLPQVWGRSVSSIFMGGGTPSLFSAASMDRLLEAIRARVKLNPDAEITLEANPGTFEIEKFAGYAQAGINRLSIGIQSFNAEHLTALGRIHNRDEALRAIEIAAKHFDNYNLDIMYALPNQTLLEAEADIDQAIACGSTHLSAYHLTLEPNTLFHRYPPALPDEDLAADMQEMIEAKLAAAGFEHYETSAFAKSGRRSQHNLNYWQFGDYLGIGAGAHGKISFHDKIIRQARFKQPSEYLAKMAAGSAIQTEEVIEKSALPFEFMLNTLRLIGGFPIALFTERTGLPMTKIIHEIERACAEGLLERDLHHVKPTLKGQRFLNVLMERFLPD